MKKQLRWSSKDYKCECGQHIRVGELTYICKCCKVQLCKKCGAKKDE